MIGCWFLQALSRYSQTHLYFPEPSLSPVFFYLWRHLSAEGILSTSFLYSSTLCWLFQNDCSLNTPTNSLILFFLLCWLRSLSVQTPCGLYSSWRFPRSTTIRIPGGQNLYQEPLHTRFRLADNAHALWLWRVLCLRIVVLIWCPYLIWRWTPGVYIHLNRHTYFSCAASASWNTVSRRSERGNPYQV